jgi:hypothetical protein
LCVARTIAHTHTSRNISRVSRRARHCPERMNHFSSPCSETSRSPCQPVVSVQPGIEVSMAVTRHETITDGVADRSRPKGDFTRNQITACLLFRPCGTSASRLPWRRRPSLLVLSVVRFSQSLQRNATASSLRTLCEPLPPHRAPPSAATITAGMECPQKRQLINCTLYNYVCMTCAVLCYITLLFDRLCGPVVRAPGCISRGLGLTCMSELPREYYDPPAGNRRFCQILGATRFSVKWMVWNGVHSAS